MKNKTIFIQLIDLKQEPREYQMIFFFVTVPTHLTELHASKKNMLYFFLHVKYHPSSSVIHVVKLSFFPLGNVTRSE